MKQTCVIVILAYFTRAEMVMRWVCHLIDHQFRLKQLLTFCFPMATVLSDSRQHLTLVKCERWQAFLKKAYTCIVNMGGVRALTRL